MTNGAERQLGDNFANLEQATMRVEHIYHARLTRDISLGVVFKAQNRAQETHWHDIRYRVEGLAPSLSIRNGVGMMTLRVDLAVAGKTEVRGRHLVARAAPMHG